MSSRDVYEDLPEFDIGADLERLTIENEELHQRIVQLEAEVASLTQIVTNLKKVQQNLTVNISELYKTALNEINRKNQTIIDLRLQLDDLIFKRQHKDDFKHKKIEIVEKKRCRSPSLDKHTSKRPRSEFNRSKSYDRHLHKISPRKSVYTERRDDRSHQRSKTRERSCTRERSKDSQKHRHKDAAKRDHKISEKTEKSKKHKHEEQISNSVKENLENKKVDDDNFLKTANTKGNIYKKELFHDQNVVTNHKRSEKRRIDVVTKKLFEKAEQVVKATKPVVEARYDEKQSMKRPIEGDKQVKTVGAEIKDRGNKDDPLLEKKKMTSSKSENLTDNAKSESAETKPIDNIKIDPPKETAEKQIVTNLDQNRIEETIEVKKDNEIDKKSDLEKADNNDDNSTKDRGTETKNNGIIGTTVNEEVKITTVQETEEKSPEKIVEQVGVTAEDSSKSQIASKPSDLSLESQMNDLFNSPIVADQTNETQTDTKTIEEILTTTPNQSANSNNSLNDITLKNCIVQLKSDDIVNSDDKKTSPIQPNTPSGRILRSSTKRINYNHLFGESPTKTIKPARTKRRRLTARQNPPLPAIEAASDDIPVLHINEDSATKCEQLLELAQIELSPEAHATVVASTPQKPCPDMALLPTAANSDNSLTDSNISNISNTGVRRPKRRRCFIKMID